MTNPLRSLIKAISLLLLLFQAVFISGCALPHVERPATDGYLFRAPTPYTKAVVWGGRLDIMQSASTWLSKQGVLVVDQTSVLQAAEKHNIVLTENKNLETDILRLSRSVGARLLVFINSEVGTWHVGFARTPLYSATVYVRGVNVNSGEIEWIGKAQSLQRFRNMEDGITLLTCHALATALGMRQPGVEAPSTVCPR